MTDPMSDSIADATAMDPNITSDTGCNAQQIATKIIFLNDGTKKLMLVNTSPCVYSRNTTGSSSRSILNDALDPSATAESCNSVGLPQFLAPSYSVVRTHSADLNGCVSTPNTLSFEDVKAVLAPHNLPCGVVHEIHSCVLQRQGFKEMQWPYILDENLVFEPRKSALLLAMYNLGIFCNGIIC
ncbi:hypothetical protein DFH29DRAFT_1009117 [Suillus ampliporus]|nr:hypothetical protein DFH29DRAFT_1009117 [Suillus ampliporus]